MQIKPYGAIHRLNGDKQTSTSQDECLTRKSILERLIVVELDVEDGNS